MIDEKAITLYFDDDHDLFNRFVALFVAQTPDLLNSIRQLIAAGQLSEAGTAIHALKGQLRYLGLNPLSKQLEQLEQLTNHQGNQEKVEAGWSTFKDDFSPAYQYLKKY